MSSDHPIFKRLSRQQLIVRRQSIGFQTLLLDRNRLGDRKGVACNQCGRHFNAIWKAFLCHVCGLFVCEPCSNVVEREREPNRVQFIRTCFDCLGLLNKWADADLLSQYASAPWIVASSKCQLPLNLADHLRGSKGRRQAVLVLLRHLGRSVDAVGSLLDNITEDQWTATATQGVHVVTPDTTTSGPSETSSSQMMVREDSFIATSSREFECAQYLVQQCFEVCVPNLPLSECVFAESDGTREYPLVYDMDQEIPLAPIPDTELERVACIERFDLLSDRNINMPEMQLICDLVVRELDAHSAFISVMHSETQHGVACPEGVACFQNVRAHTFCAYGVMAPLPFFVRDASMDIRFRNFPAVNKSSNATHMYLYMPIFADNGTAVASLSIVDTQPRKSITTMQYAILKKLSEIVSVIWQENLQKQDAELRI